MFRTSFGKTLGLWLVPVLGVLLALGTMAPPAPAAAVGDACSVQVTLFTAPFVTVDSNSPGVQGPKVAMIGARITNTGATPLASVSAHIGNGTTPGTFNPVSGGAPALLDAADATHTYTDLAPGASVATYWPLTYPFTYNVSYPYTVWATTPAGCSVPVSSTLTTQSEISAAANKLLPTGSTLLVYPETVSPGGLITVQITGFELGTIGQGPRPLQPYDAWLQPVGNLDFDPTCLRLVGSEVYMASLSPTPYVDRLYFSGIGHYDSDPADYVRYTFIALRDCATTIQPYQEAASGTQEKYNGDYENATSRISVVSSGSSALTLAVSADSTTPGAGQTVTIAADFSTSSGTVGAPDAGAPVILTAAVPDQTTFVAGSATATTGATVEYSTDGGATWSSSAPNPATVTDVRWLLDEAVTVSAESVTFDVTFAAGYDGTAVLTTISAALPGSSTLADATVAFNGTAPTPTPTPTPSPTPDPGVGSGEDGGLESGPLAGDPSTFLGGVGQPGGGDLQAGSTGGSAPVAHKARLTTVMSLSLADLLPAEGPAGTVPTDVVPVDVLSTTTAPDARAVDFVDDSGQVRAVALGIQTLDGPYEHDYGVCNRFKEYTFDAIAPVAVAGLDPSDPAAAYWFWRGRAAHGADTLEDALIFHIFVDEAGQTFHVDSRWIQDSYPDTFAFDFDYVFSMQVWSSDPATSSDLLAGIIDRLYALDGGSWTVSFRSSAEPPAPQVYVRSAVYSADSVRLTLVNLTDSFATVNVHGTWRAYDDRLTSVPFSRYVGLPPGTSTLALTFAGLLDTTVYVDYGDFTDKVYSGGGLWFAFSNSTSATATMTLGDCRPIDAVNPEDLLLAGCVDGSGSGLTLGDEVGIGRTLNPNGRPVDVSPYAALRFWAKGNGAPVRLLLETAGVTDGDYYQTVITPGSDWQQFVINLDQLAQRGFGTPVPYTGSDVVAVVWLNADAAGGDFTLSVDQVTFTNSATVTLATAPADSADTGARPVAVTVPTGAAVDSMTLFYSVDDGDSYAALPMTRSGDRFDAVIPGQPLGSDVRYYVESADTFGYTSRTPVAAPAGVWRYRVDDRPGLLVDDYAAGHLRNRLDGSSGVFNDPLAGGSLLAYKVDQALVLDYDVTQPGQSAGYFTALGGVDAQAYTTLNLQVRGAFGGEQLFVSLKDGSGYEPRLSVGDLLPGGITRDWGWAQIPLAAFPGDLDLGDLQTLAFSFAADGGTAAGQVSVKEVRLTTLAAPVTIDTFDDADLALNGRGLAPWQTAQNATLTAGATLGDALNTSGYALKLAYTVNSGGYALWASPLGGVSVPAGAELRLWVRAEGATLLPNLYLTDGTTRAFVALDDYVTPSMQWQPVVVPLSAFTAQGVKRTLLQEFQIAFEFGSGSGAVWFDEITLGAPGKAQAERRVLHLNDTDAHAVALHLPWGGAWSVSADTTWLSTARDGAGPSTLTVRSNSRGLQPGTYSGTLTVTNGFGSETITVNLVVTAFRELVRLFMPVGLGQ